MSSWRLNPNSAWTFNEHGLAWHQKRAYARTNADYTQGLKLDFKYEWAYHNRGLSWHDQKDYDKAIADYAGLFVVLFSFLAAVVRRPQ